MLLAGVGPIGLLLHVVEPQRQDRQPVDRAAGRFGVLPRAGCGTILRSASSRSR